MKPEKKPLDGMSRLVDDADVAGFSLDEIYVVPGDPPPEAARETGYAVLVDDERCTT